MQLDEEEFNIAQLVEDVVDLHHPGGMKKGVDVVLDTHDGSILKFSDVKGDRGRLNQILNNLLSNAVKFTSEGHVTVRAWARKHKVNQLMLDSNHDGFLKYLSCLLFHKNNEETRKDLEATNGEGQNTNLIEFIFEVDDTGVGIPKEKRESVFENFVQVKETALGKGGTGLGLGIVQSLVRLMGGEIGIVDKEIGKKGTCFRFNVYLTASGTSSTDIFDSGEESRSGLLTNLAICSPTEGLSMRTPSPRLNFLGRKPSLKLEGSHVVLLMGDEERRRVSHKFMESLGINVYVVNQWEQLASTLNKLKSKWNTSHSSIGSSGKLEISQPLSDASSGRLKDVPLSSMDGTDQKPPLYRRKGSPGFVLMVIDATVGPFSELLSVVADFKSGLQSTCYKAVWLNKPISCRIERENLDPSDDVLLKPLHGSRLYEVIKLLPEFGVASASPQGTLNKPEKESTVQRNFLKDFSSSSAKQTYVSPKSGNPPPRRQSRHHGEIEENDSSDDEKSGKKVLPFSPIQTRGGRFEVGPSLQQTEIQEEFTNLPIDNKPLSGKRILVVEDDRVIRILAGKKISQLGATVELCEDGEKAKKLVCNGLRDQTNNGAPHILPYDYILMDCEMEPMTGSEATRSIRAEEKHYGVHIPIIAFTSHESEEARKTIDSAGMDAHFVIGSCVAEG